MYQQFNDQFTQSTRQFADTSAQVGRLALENTEAVFGLQLAAIEESIPDHAEACDILDVPTFEVEEWS